MARRCGQKGYVEQKGDWWHVRYRDDTCDGRSYKSHPICKATGKAKKTKSEARRLGAEWLHEQNINKQEPRTKFRGRVLTFEKQSELWLDGLQKRRRNPIPDSSVASIQSALDRWLLPNVGNKPLGDVNNPALRDLVTIMSGTLSPKTINTYVNMAKQIVESLLDDDGEPVHKRKWNNDFIDLPIVNKREQLRPKFSKEVVTTIIGACQTDWERMLYILLPAAGLRIAECLALEIGKHISPDCRLIQVRQQVKGNKLITVLKTDAAYRDVDLCLEAAAELKQYIGSRDGLLFASKTGKTPRTYTNVRRRSLIPMLEKLNLYSRWGAMHCFRRFRSSVLKKNRCPDDLAKFWLGHQNRDVTDQYAEQLREDLEWRQQIAASIGLGFELPPAPRVRKQTAREVQLMHPTPRFAPKMQEEETARLAV